MAYIKTEWIKDVTLIKAEFLNKIEEELDYLDKSVDSLRLKDIELGKRIDTEKAERVASDEVHDKLIQALRSDVKALQEFDVSIDLRLKDEISNRIVAIKNLDESLTKRINTVDLDLQNTKADLKAEIGKRTLENEKLKNLLNDEVSSRVKSDMEISKKHLDDTAKLMEDIAVNNSNIAINSANIDSLFKITVSKNEEYSDLLTVNKTVFGAINELQQLSASQSEMDEVKETLQYIMDTLAKIKIPLS